MVGRSVRGAGRKYFLHGIVAKTAGIQEKPPSTGGVFYIFATCLRHTHGVHPLSS